MFETERRDGVLRVAREGTCWLHTGWQGGRRRADAAYNVTVPEGWDPQSIRTYVTDRLASAGFDADGPVLLTGVAMEHARGARIGPVAVIATVGLSNPAALPLDPGSGGSDTADGGAVECQGTVNLIVGTTRHLAEGAMANAVATVAEAKTATLLARTGFTGTTSDAVVVGSDPDGPRTTESGSATDVGAAIRAAVREAVTASLRARYDGRPVPESVADADHGVETTARAEVYRP